MKKYIRTKDGRIVDVGAFIEEEKKSRYYKDHVFDEIENRDGKCYLHYAAFGTEENDIYGQRGAWVEFLVSIDSPFIKQADTIEELCDCFVDYCEEDDSHFVSTAIQGKHEIYGAIWTDRGLIYVAKMNGKGEIELL